MPKATKEEILNLFLEIRKPYTPRRVKHIYETMVHGLGIGRLDSREIIADCYDTTETVIAMMLIREKAII
jgi:hypothetical protein